MYPFLKPGDRIVVKIAQQNSLQIGDIIVAPSGKDRFLVHRLIKILPPDRCILKGDSLLNPDPEPIKLSDISGKVIDIEKESIYPGGCRFQIQAETYLCLFKHQGTDHRRFETKGQKPAACTISIRYIK